MAGQINDASLVPAPNSAIPRATEKDTEARWTLKIGGKQRLREDDTPPSSSFRYKTHISIDRRFGFIRAAAVTSTVYADGGRLHNHIHHKKAKGEPVPRATG